MKVDAGDVGGGRGRGEREGGRGERGGGEGGREIDTMEIAR